MSSAQSERYVLKFISGKYQGGEFPLEMGQEVVIGRSSELDMVLVEDMVSRRHAKITAEDGELKIEDFNSTNGTFVNGKKISETTLEEGDRILIGTSIIKLVKQDEAVDQPDSLDNVEEVTDQAAAGGGGSRQTQLGMGADGPAGAAAGSATATSPDQGEPAPDNPGGAPPADQPHHQQAPAHAGQRPDTQSGEESAAEPQQGGGQSGATLSGSISGLIEEVPLPDLLQLFSTSQKSGVLVVRSDNVGKVYLREGRVYYATINDDPDIDPYKAFYRMLAWEEGTFSLEQPDDTEFEDELDESIENLLMEGMKQLDEIKNLGDDVPDLQQTLRVQRPLVPPLRSLNDELLDTLQLVFNYGKVSTVLNKSLASDVETMEDIVHLRRKDYILVEEADDTDHDHDPATDQTAHQAQQPN